MYLSVRACDEFSATPSVAAAERAARLRSRGASPQPVVGGERTACHAGGDQPSGSPARRSHRPSRVRARRSRPRSHRRRRRGTARPARRLRPPLGRHGGDRLARRGRRLVGQRRAVVRGEMAAAAAAIVRARTSRDRRPRVGVDATGGFRPRPHRRRRALRRRRLPRRLL